MFTAPPTAFSPRAFFGRRLAGIQVRYYRRLPLELRLQGPREPRREVYAHIGIPDRTLARTSNKRKSNNASGAFKTHKSLSPRFPIHKQFETLLLETNLFSHNPSYHKHYFKCLQQLQMSLYVNTIWRASEHARFLNTPEPSPPPFSISLSAGCKVFN